MHHHPLSGPLSRREALKRVIGLSVALAAVKMPAFANTPGVKTIGTDPNLLAKEIPWDLVLTEAERKTVTALGDLFIPADDLGPAASSVGVPEFIDEWVSAPYETQQKDLVHLRDALVWFDKQAQQRFGKNFADLSLEQQTAIFDDIVAEGTPAREQAFGYFQFLRHLVAGGYFTTPEGWQAIGYVGNIPMAEYPGPPDEVLRHVGLL